MMSRVETYLTKGKRGSEIACLNGPAVCKGAEEDVIISMSHALMDFDEVKTFKPIVIFPREGNKL
jgi:aspartate 1-decarboxylase